MAEDKDRKKHPASKRKLARARERGQVAFSRQLCSGVSWFLGVLALLFSLPEIGSSLGQMAKSFWGGAHENLFEIQRVALSSVIKAVGPCALAALMGCLLVGFVQVRVPLRIRMDWKRLNLVEGFKRLLSVHRLADLAFVLVRMSILVLVAALWARSDWGAFMTLTDLHHGIIMAFRNGSVLLILLGLAGVLGGLLDWWLQRRRFLRKQRMSTEELKRERKDQDGDPAIKAERRRRHRSLLAGTGMGALPNAKVVLINPTHIAVALRYEPSTDEAPVVLVAGRDERAIRIRNKALALGLPVVEQVQLARALVSLDEGDFVPEQQYAAVAEIIRLVQSMA